MRYENRLLHEAIRLLMISARLQRRHTQQSLSMESGISRQFISQMECGKRVPSIETLAQVALALKTTIGSLSLELDKIYLHLSWQKTPPKEDAPTSVPVPKAAESTAPSLEYIRKTGGLRKP